MKMILATIRPEKIFEVSKGLETNGYYASTRWGVSGRGRQKGIQVGDIVYEEMSKNMLVVVVDDEEKDEVVRIIMDYARSGENGNSGDGKIFVVPVEESYTVSTREKDK